MPIPGGGLPDLGGLSKLAEKVPSVSGLAGSLPGAGALSGIAGGLTSGLVPELGSIVGGAGSAVLEFMAINGYSAQVKMLGMPDSIVEHGSQEELYRECEYDDVAIVECTQKMIGKKVKASEKASA